MTANSTDIEITIEDAAWVDALPDADSLSRRAALAACRAGAKVPLDRAEVGIVLTGDAAVRDLNLRYRGKDRPTNVLSFAASDMREGTLKPGAVDGAGGAAAPLLLGDVIVAYDTVAREAEAAARPLADHLAHMVVHGVLHLLGYDHETDAGAAVMEGLETSVLAGLRVPDPYATPDATPARPWEESEIQRS